MPPTNARAVRIRGGGCATSKPVEAKDVMAVADTGKSSNEVAQPGALSSAEAPKAFVQELDLPGTPMQTTESPTGPLAMDTVLLLSELGPIKAFATVDAKWTCSSSEASVTLAPGVVVVVAKGKSTTRYAVTDAIEDAEIENEDFGEATAHELPDGGWLFEAVNDPEPGHPMRFDVSSRRVIGGKAYTAVASVGTLAHQAMASEFCRRLTTSAAPADV